MNHSLPVLIVGQGLAGSLLAWELLRRGRRVLVVDDHHRGSATRVAAGLFNPVTGRRLVLQADADRLVAAAETTYAALAAELGAPVFHPRPLLRLLRDGQEAALIERRRGMAAYGAYLGPSLAAGAAEAGLRDPHGSLLQNHTGYLDTAALLDGMARWLNARGAYERGLLDPARLRPHGDQVSWDGRRFAAAVLCQGHRIAADPWFGWLPMQPAKGEILTLALDRPGPAHILSAGHWLLPLGADRCRVGATYQWSPLDQRPSRAAREQLLASAAALFAAAPRARVLAHDVGIRPASRDTRPLLGRHPRWPALALFNGLGSKGSLLAPWCAARLAAHLCEDAPLPPRFDLHRFAEAEGRGGGG